MTTAKDTAPYNTSLLDCGSISQNIIECMQENGVDLEKEGLV